MKRLLSKILPACYSVLALAAVVSVKPTCAWFWHQPEVPAALKK